VTRTYPSLPEHLQAAHAAGQLPRSSELPVSNALREVLRACLQRKPELRPTAQQLLAHEYVRGRD